MSKFYLMLLNYFCFICSTSVVCKIFTWMKARRNKKCKESLHQNVIEQITRAGNEMQEKRKKKKA